MEVKFVRTGQLKPGNYVLIDGFVCQIKSIDLSKPGKHGSAKARVTAIGVFDDSKRQLLKPATDDTEVPIIEKGNAQFVADMGGSIQVMDTSTYSTFDSPKPKDIGTLKPGDEVEYIKCDANVRIIRKK
ncbi:MAG: translation initiation factor IF-5A [Candidatus Diapherotrites archaeon]